MSIRQSLSISVIHSYILSGV